MPNLILNFFLFLTLNGQSLTYSVGHYIFKIYLEFNHFLTPPPLPLGASWDSVGKGEQDDGG